MTTARASVRRRRGSSLVEVLLALAILSLLMVGILQMFSVALIVNLGAGARTTLIFKCQQVVENLRYYYSAAINNRVTADYDALLGADLKGACKTCAGYPVKVDVGPNTGVPWPMPLAMTTFQLPYNADPAIPDTNNPKQWAYWGPAGADVMEAENGPYKVTYTIQRDLTNNVFVINVAAIPTDIVGSGNDPRFFGISLSKTVAGLFVNAKRVDYVAQF